MVFKKSDGTACGVRHRSWVAFAKELPCKVYLEHNGKKAAADSILQLLALGAKEGSELVLSADGEGDEHSVEKLEAFLAILEG